MQSTDKVGLNVKLRKLKEKFAQIQVSLSDEELDRMINNKITCSIFAIFSKRQNSNEQSLEHFEYVMLY